MGTITEHSSRTGSTHTLKRTVQEGLWLSFKGYFA